MSDPEIEAIDVTARAGMTIWRGSIGWRIA